MFTKGTKKKLTSIYFFLAVTKDALFNTRMRVHVDDASFSLCSWVKMFVHYASFVDYYMIFR